MLRFMRKIKYKLLLFVSTVMSLYVIYSYNRPHASVKYNADEVQSDKSQMAQLARNVVRIKNEKSCRSNDTKLILFYTNLFSRKPWKDIDSTETFLVHCPSKNCKISYDTIDIRKSDLAVFHAGEMPPWEEVEEIHRNRFPHQRMAFLRHESPKWFKHETFLAPNGFFNWSITFKRSSDFTIPYGHYFPRNSIDVKREQNVNFAEGKNKLVAWAVSHCGTVRQEYVKQLVKHIKVDVYGGCSKVYGQNNECPRGSSQCGPLFKTYKFYLAFENAICTDYITEKFWRTLNWKVVPIVLTRDYYNVAAPPGSFISVQDFPSVKALADYLLYLDKNDTAYNAYFQWRRKFSAEVKDWFRFVACDICDALHEKCLPPKAYGRVESFWNRNVDCEERERLFLKRIKETSM